MREIVSLPGPAVTTEGLSSLHEPSAVTAFGHSWQLLSAEAAEVDMLGQDRTAEWAVRHCLRLKLPSHGWR